MRAVLVVAWVVAAMPARAESTAKQVRFVEVIAALPHAPSMQVSRHEIAAAEARLEAARAWPSPSFHAQTNRLTARAVGGVTLPLPIFGTVSAARQVAAAQRDAVLAGALVNDRDIVRRAAIAWIALARADAELVDARTTEAQAVELERIAQGRFDTGAGAEVDVMMAHAARARAGVAVAAAARAKEAASAELAGILGWNPSVVLEAAGELPGADVGTLERLRTSLARHPTYVLAERQVAAADAAVAEVRTQRWPTVSLEGQASFLDPTTPGTDVLVGLSLDVPLFSRIGDRIRSARATSAAERARASVTTSQLEADLVAAYRQWQSASERLTALEATILPAQDRAQKLARQAYREGAINLAGALQTDRDLAAVRAEVVAARTDLANAWVTLQDAAGQDLRGPHAP